MHTIHAAVLLLMAAASPALASDAERLRHIAQEVDQVHNAVAEQEQRVKELERQLGDMEPHSRASDPQAARDQEALTQGD